MTEKDKMLKGLVYNANHDDELINERITCKELCEQYNKTSYSDFDRKRELIKEIVKTAKGTFLIEQPFYCDYGYNIEIGENFYSNHNLVILDGAPVTFGDNVFIGPNCGFYSAGHAINAKERSEGLEFTKPITIGNNVWLGGNVVVMPGVTIGDSSIIGAGSVVTKDIPSGVIAVGNPCKVLREIDDKDK